MDVMVRLDSVENNYKKDVTVLNDRIDELSKENDSLKKIKSYRKIMHD